MAVRSKIVFGDREAIVDDNGFLQVAVSNVPIQSIGNNQIIYRRFLTLDNDGSTASMLVNGSTTPQVFSIESQNDRDTFITSLSFVIAGDSLALGNDFAGSGSPLTNGCRLYYEDDVNGEINIGTDLQTNFDFIRLCQGVPAFADPTLGPFVADDISGASGKGSTPADGILPVLNIKDIFGLAFGIKLKSNAKDKLVLEVNDNLSTGLGANASFNIIAYGFEVKLDAVD